MTQARTPLLRFEVGVDIGGTFTDVVCRSDSGEVRLVKIPTTRANPSAGVLHAVQHMAREWNVAPASITRFVHGTTVATNAVLERKGAKIGLICTEGFRDTLEIGRQNRHAVYSVLLRPETPAFLAPGALRREVAGRMSADGTELTALDEAAVRREADELVAAGVRAIAVSFLFSYLNPAHERRAAEIIRAAHPSLMVSLSCEVDPAFREYERTCITAFDAYLKPVIDRYLEDMERDLEAVGVGSTLQIMQSRGGVASSRIARRRPVRLFLSGPAAGVIGGSMAGLAAGFDDVITIDIGGTSADIALVSGGRPMIAAEGMLDGYAVRVPMVDVNAIGAGGGSIAWIDGAKSLRVGPASAGSEPGPACYARGGEQPTVTDASIVLGYLDPAYFAGGSLKLQPELSRQAIERKVAVPLGLTVEQAALGIHRVVNANMAEGIRFVSIKRGIDPRRFGLVPLGGGGPVHATALARDLGMQKVVVPLHPGVLSASGLLAAPVEHEAAVAFHARLEQATPDDLARAFAALDRQCATLMQVENIDPGKVEVRYYADVCYVGQSHHIEVPVSMQDAGGEATGEPADVIARIRAGFHEAHDHIYGHSAGGPMTFVNLRAVHQAQATGERPLEGEYRPAAGEPLKGRRPIMTELSNGFVEANVYERSRIMPGTTIAGPAIIEQADTTTVIEPGWTATVDAVGNLVMTQGEAA
jgi:N-methylhydantoinase A